MFWLLNRIRGQHEDSTTTTEARLLYWAFPMMLVVTLIADMYGLPKWSGALSGLLAWGGMIIGHGFAQGDSKTQYAEMGLVCYTRLAGILLPLLLQSIYLLPIHWILFAVLPLHGLLCWGASALSYSSIFQSRSLTLFGVQWCKPGDSSWEETLTGGCYDIVFLILILGALI